jgi:hypothetical protein
MLDIKIPSKREKKPYVYGGSGYSGYVPNNHTPMQQRQVHQPTVNKVVEELPKDTNKKLFDEAVRRNKIIKDLVSKCTYRVNDRVMFSKPADEKKYGKEVYVTKIVETYGQWPMSEKWPENDNPMIVHLRVADRDDEVLFCTTNMVKPYNSAEASTSE